MTFLRIVIPLYLFVRACPFFAKPVPTFAGHALGAAVRDRAGTLVPARSQLGNREFPDIEPAPGRYVKAQGS